jgi:hypothetical protein
VLQWAPNILCIIGVQHDRTAAQSFYEGSYLPCCALLEALCPLHTTYLSGKGIEAVRLYRASLILICKWVSPLSIFSAAFCLHTWAASKARPAHCELASTNAHSYCLP